VYQDDLNGNYGPDTDLWAGYLFPSADSECDIYLFFDVSSVVPSTATIVSAELKLYVSDSFNTNGISLSIEDVDDTWEEDDITWNNRPGTTPVTQVVAPSHSFVGWFTVTSPQITALVQSWVSNSSPNNGLAILPAEGSQYGWSITVDSSENASGNSPTLVVHYNQGATQYKLTTAVSPAGGGTIARLPAATWYDPGTPVQLTAIPNSGYVFDHWSGDLSGTDNPATITMDSDKTVTANFQICQYQLTVAVSPEGVGTVECVPGGLIYDAGTVVTLTAVENAGYGFSEWSGDLTGSESPTTITMDSDKTVTANFVGPWSITSPPIEADQDAFVYEGTPTDNYGDDIDLCAGYVATGGGEQNDTYLHFDLSSISPTATVVYVELWLHIWDTYNSYHTGYSLAAVDAAWDESIITWEDVPASTPVSTFAGPADVGWYKITNPALTALVQSWVETSSANYGLAIIPLLSTTSDDEIFMDSSETPSAPYLVVHYNNP
jgi:uncharacterized repeat protein (TIGR02543 family)